MNQGYIYPPLEELVFNKNKINENYTPIIKSLYHIHMKNWLEYFPLEQIHIIDGDVFTKKPWIEMQKVEEFLQIPPVITQKNFVFNSTKGFYCGRRISKKEAWTCILEGNFCNFFSTKTQLIKNQNG